MSDHGSADNSPSCLMFAGILCIPIGVIGRIYLNSYVTTHYPKAVGLTPQILSNIHVAQTILIIIPIVGVFLLFPLGVYAFIQSHIGGGH